MKILIVSWYFPPVNTIGALRVGKFARFLIERGHDLGVVAGKHWGHPETQPLGVPLDRLIYTKSINVNAAPEKIAALMPRTRIPSAERARASVEDTHAAGSFGTWTLRRMSELYHYAINLPDKHVGWLPSAYAAANRMCQTWRPDVVFGSGPPFTGLLVCRFLSTRLRLPWIAELRDRWADDPYDEPPHWRVTLDQWLERQVLATAKGLVTVTEPWAELYRYKYGKPIATIYNGYDPRDFDSLELNDGATDTAELVISYTGGIYPGRRDPSPLFAALNMLGDTGRRFRVIFCGTDPAHVLPLAERAGVMHLIEIRPSVSYNESLNLQRRSDVLLLMQWNDPRDQGHCPAKFFEYLASRRPVLLLGLEDGVPATMMRARSAGLCANEPSVIATQLKRWLAEKDNLGKVQPLPRSASEGLSRTIQFEKLETFLSEIVERPK